MNHKINTLKDIEYLASIELLTNLVLDAQKKKDSEILQEMARAIKDVFFYVDNLQMDRLMYDKSMSQYRGDRNRAVARARRAELELDKKDKEIAKLKNISGL